MPALEIERTVETYLHGATYADADRLRRALHPEFRTVGYVKGHLHWSDRDTEIADCARGGLAVGAPMPPWGISELRISGETAVAHVESQWKDMHFREGAVLDNPIMGYHRDYEKESYQPIEARPLD